MNIKEYISSGIIEMYVMGMCSPEEQRELEDLRKKHPELEAAIHAFEENFEIQMQKSTTFPGADTDKRILDAIDTWVPPDSDSRRFQLKNRGLRRYKLAIAATLFLVLLSSYFNFTLYRKNKNQADALEALKTDVVPAETLPASDYAVMRNPAITPVAMYGVGTHAICRCTIFWDKKTGKLYIMIHHLPQSSESRDYQLWASVNGNFVSVGTIRDEIRGRFIEMGNVPPEATAFTVTLEKAGGNLTPTLEEAYLAGKI